MNTRLAAVALALAASAALSGCAAKDLEDSDPAGHRACVLYLSQSEEDLSDEDVFTYVAGTNSIAAEAAADSTTEAIRETADDLGLPELEFYTADSEDLIAACEANGYEVKEYSAAWWSRNQP